MIKKLYFLTLCTLLLASSYTNTMSYWKSLLNSTISAPRTPTVQESAYNGVNISLSNQTNQYNSKKLYENLDESDKQKLFEKSFLSHFWCLSPFRLFGIKPNQHHINKLNNPESQNKSWDNIIKERLSCGEINFLLRRCACDNDIEAFEQSINAIKEHPKWEEIISLSLFLKNHYPIYHLENQKNELENTLICNMENGTLNLDNTSEKKAHFKACLREVERQTREYKIIQELQKQHNFSLEQAIELMRLDKEITTLYPSFDEYKELCPKTTITQKKHDKSINAAKERAASNYVQKIKLYNENSTLTINNIHLDHILKTSLPSE